MTLSNSDLELEAKLYLRVEELQAILGVPTAPGIVAVQVRIVPKPGKTPKVWADDFTLASDKDGQRSTPYAPEQIAGSSTLTVRRTVGGYVGAEQTGPVWGGVGGPIGRMPGNSGNMGTAPGQTENQVLAGDQTAPANSGKPNPLLDALKAKVLVEGLVEAPREGYLFFPLEGKHRPKQLELIFGKSRKEWVRAHFQE